MSPYSAQWYRSELENSLHGARAIVPLLMEMFHPTSVIDVGCGTGAWLSVFRDQGVKVLQGLDGEWVLQDQLLIPREDFKPADLTKKFEADKHYDLAMSLEVAEHLPASAAENLVYSLTRLAPVIVFSAAVPGQGGNTHVNEQWPGYWAALFEKYSYEVVDCIRPRIWHREEVAACYLQNTLLYISNRAFELYPWLRDARKQTENRPLSVVHPKMFMSAQSDLSLRQVLKVLPNAFRESVRWHLAKRWGA
jgi:SAM-dependent methyltransferase